MLALLAERRGWKGFRRHLLPLAALIVLAVLFLLQEGWTRPVALRRHAQFNAGFHLLVAFLPFVCEREAGPFWELNKALFLRFLTAVLYSGVLFLGLALALAALDALFGIDVPGERYFQLLAVVAFVFNTWFFLGGVPDPTALEPAPYPRGLRLFAQFLLVPIAAVYLAILTAYLVKILATQEWPSGWIGYLVTGVAVVGILAALLVYPIRELPDARWAGRWARWLFVLLLPPVAMLLAAAYQRIAQYGITENRYFLGVLGLWLGAISVFYALRGFERIRLLPATLCLVALGTAFGPWGAYAVSERSQRARLGRLLAANGIAAGQPLDPARRPVPVDDRREISAILRYLVEAHGPEALARATGVAAAEAPPPSGTGEPEPDRRARAFAERLGVEYVDRWAPSPDDGRFHYQTTETNVPRTIAGYEHMVLLAGPGEIAVEGERLALDYDPEAAAFRLRRPGGPPIELPLAPLLASLEDEGPSVPLGILSLEGDNARTRVRLDFRYLAGTRRESGGVSLDGWNADVFLALDGGEEGGGGGP